MKTEHFWQLFFIFIGAFVSAYAGYYFTNQPKEDLVLQYQTYTDINLKKTLGETGDIKVFHNGNELDNLSKSIYSVANLSANNLGKTKLYFEFNTPENLPIFHSVSSHKDIPDQAIKLLSSIDGVYIFEIDFFNKMDRIWDGLDFNFYFVGKDQPKAIIKAGSKGLKVIEYKIETPSFIGYILIGAKKLWWLLLLAGLFGYLNSKYEKIRRSLISKKQDEILSEALNEAPNTTSEDVVIIKEKLLQQPKFSEVINNWNT